jgi:NifU-like protein involved in Fe-S cluster formation
MNAPLYTTEILRLAASLAEPGELERVDGKAEVRSPTCGSRIFILVSIDKQGRVEAVSQRVHACAFGQASSALLERGAIGLNQAEIETAIMQLESWLGGSETVPHWPRIATLAPARPRRSRHGAILLPFRALIAAMESAAIA